MKGRGFFQVVTVVLGTALGASAQEVDPIHDPRALPSSAEDCSFQADRDGYLTRQLRTRREVFDRAGKFGRQAGGGLTISPSELPRRNFIDVEIFDRLGVANIPSARLSSDAEFVRRIHLDLTGRLPSSEDVRNFLSDNRENKRDLLIDSLLYSPAFVSKWTVWLGELMQNAQTLPNVTRNMVARNTYFDWMKYSLIDQKSLKQMAYEALSAGGNTYLIENGPANFTLNGRSSTGPGQDTYDWMLYNATSKFLGVGHYDCLLCHDGRRHLDDLSLWGR